MRALLRKDRYWLLGFAIAGLVIQLGLQATQSRVWTRPDNNFTQIALAFGWIVAGLMGLTAALIDEVTRTREYLHHRAVSPERIFWTRQAACLTIIAAWIVVVPALHLGLTLLIREDTAVIDVGRYWSLVDEASPTFVFYATVYFCSTLVRRLVWALPLAVLGSGFAVAFTIESTGEYTRWGGPIPLILVCLLLTSVLLAAALANERQAREADLPWTPQRLRLAGVMLLLIAVPGASFCLFGLQDSIRQGLNQLYPDVARIAGGAPTLVGHRLLGRGKPVRLDDQHRVLGDVPPESVATLWTPRYDPSSARRSFAALASRGSWFRGQRYTSLYCASPLHCFASSDGVITVIREVDDLYRRMFDDLDPDGLPGGIHRVGIGPGDQPFPLQAMPIGQWWDGTAYVGDPESGLLWSAQLDVADPHFAPVALPGGDRFRSDLLADARTRILWPAGSPFYRVIVAGDHGVYVPGEEGVWISAPAAVIKLLGQDAANRGLRFVTTPTGAFSFVLDVTDTSTGPDSQLAPRSVLHHLYMPRTALEKTVAGALTVTSLLRPPIFAVPSRLFSVHVHHSPGPTWLIDPAMRLGSVWLLIGNLFLAAGLAALINRRLARLQAPSGRVWFWTGAVLLGGAPAFVCARLIETRRAWQRVPAPDPASVAPRLLIESA
jgi:hypothetical protein